MLDGAALADLAQEYVSKPNPSDDPETQEQRDASYARRLESFVATVGALDDAEQAEEIQRLALQRAERLKILRLKFRIKGYMGLPPVGDGIMETAKDEIRGYQKAIRGMVNGGPRRRTIGIINTISDEWKRDRPKRRAAHLAYGLLRDRPYSWMENEQTTTLPDFGRVAMEARRTMLDKKSPDPTAQQRLEQRIHEWLQTAYQVPHIAALLSARDGAARAQVEA